MIEIADANQDISLRIIYQHERQDNFFLGRYFFYDKKAINHKGHVEYDMRIIGIIIRIIYTKTNEKLFIEYKKNNTNNNNNLLTAYE